MVTLNCSSLRTRGRDTYILHGEAGTAFRVIISHVSLQLTIKKRNIQSSIVQRENFNTGVLVCTQNLSRHLDLTMYAFEKIKTNSIFMFCSILKCYPEYTEELWVSG